MFYTLLAFVLIQFIPVDKTNLPVDEKVNFVMVEKTPSKIVSMLKSSCYDCHSNETRYPKYASVAPVSWSIKSHVEEGRDHMNFSVWKNYNNDLKKSMLEKSIQTIENRSMPLPGYIVYHNEANLSTAERKVLSKYFGEVLKTLK
ncbi:heme-binding domain-containing protein [Chryseobacterium sp. Leaf180]|uniref:heme-binding domain-containing protein n=1 Tax=Chryseobacterium sp. Leaf180 TaxID=1736289 RepID=UPI000B2A0182|nr:heme-binding domain-containing protein [Chryseobacterium sp. Leaf180]